MRYSILLLLFSFISYISCQHTTSLKFTGGGSTATEPVFCPQVVCPTDNLTEPSCPVECPNNCQIVPDKCCPQKKVATCNTGNPSSSIASSPVSSTATATATSSITSATSTVSSSQTSATGSQTSTGNNPSNTPSSASNMKPSVYLSILLFIFVYLLA
ncbi:unnamed protein product [Cunninghamella blakesleeana]